MKFVDEATISVTSGNGGRGCVSFRRERFVPKGGPDGGDGGTGGSVVFVSDPQKRTLIDFRYQRQLKAENGQPGQGSGKTGRSGETLNVPVPVGTIIRDAGSGEILHDFTMADDRFVAARGGRGGRGNTRFKTSTNRAPRHAQPGEPGESRLLALELKLLADVGLVGLPNAGKSTLISRLTAARPKVADYPFTTLTPHLGVVHSNYSEPFVIADIPGLIEGAHEGAGLGIRFLKHIERTRVLVHMVDASAVDPDDPLKSFHTINAELESYNPSLSEKSQIVVLNKMDVPEAATGIEAFQNAMGSREVLAISARENKGLEKLLTTIIVLLDRKNGCPDSNNA